MLIAQWIRFVAALVAVGAVFAAPATAQQTRYPVDLPSQPLEESIRAIGRITGTNVVFSPQTVRGRTAKAVKGELTVEEALGQAVAGTPLEARRASGSTVIIREREGNGQDREPKPGAQSAIQLEAITVTATKREERLIDVPSSIGVVTREDIERRGLVNASDYLRGIPGANQVEAYQGQSIVIRGMETSPRAQNFSSGTTVATYFGETPTTNTGGLSGGTNIDIKLVDVERVEVLRGPQGTAFGNSSMGGAVRTIPVAPRLDRVEGKVSGSYSVTSGTGGDNYDVQVVGNFPIVRDTLAVRAVAYSYQDSGFYRNVAGSDAAFQTAVVTRYGAQAAATNEEEVGSYYARGGRIAALYRATNALRFTLTFLSQKTETDGIPLANVGPYAQTLLHVAPEHADGRKLGFFDTELTIANATAEFDLGWATLLGTYSRTRSDWIHATPFGSTGTQWALSYAGPGPHREQVGEIRIVSRLQGPLNFLAGLYAEKLDDEIAYSYVWFGDPATSPLARNCATLGPECQQGRLAARYAERRSLEQKAAFGEVSWEFRPGLTATGGIRSYDYERTVRIDGDGAFYGPAGNHSSAGAEATGQTYRANLSYKPSDNGLVYASWAQGFRLGRPQAGLPVGVCDVDGNGVVDGTSTTVESTRRVNADNVDSYEVGAKFELLDRRLALAADVFRMDWSDVPVNVLAGSLGTPPAGCRLLSFVANAGSARSEGIEVQANFQVSRALRVDIGASRINAKLTEDVPALNVSRGNRLPGSPQVNANLGLQYDLRAVGFGWSLRADATYLGSFYGNLQQSPNTRSGGYTKVDVSARLAARNFSIDLFVRNLTDEDAFTFRSDGASTGAFFGYQMRPRTVGVRATYNF